MILLGPPGSGRTTQAELIARRYGLVHICTRSLLKGEIARNPDVGKIISQSIDTGSAVPDEVVISLIEQRLKQSDCRVNGWIMDGFPQSESQINLLRSMKIKPSLVVMFEQPEEESVRRLQVRRIDPSTGTYYNLQVNPPRDEATASRLVELPEDKEAIIKKRVENWNSQVSNLEEAFKSILLNVSSDRSPELISEQINDAIQNPLF